MGPFQRISMRTGPVSEQERAAPFARHGVFLGAIAVLLLVACGGPTATAPSAPGNPSPATQAALEPPGPTATESPNIAPTQEPLRESSSGAITSIEIAEGSGARYRVNEQLARRDLPSDAVGETSIIEGSFVFDSEGRVLSAQSIVIVDMKNLNSGQEKRDNFLRERSLESNLFPTATFALRETDGLPWPLPKSGEHSFRMIGDLTIKDVTREVVWEATLRVDGDSLSGEAKTEFTFDYFEINKPSLVFLLSVADEIGLELDLVAQITSGQ